MTFLKEHEVVKSVFDYLVAPGVIVSTFIGWLPAAAAVLSITWYGIQIYDRYRYGPKK